MKAKNILLSLSLSTLLFSCEKDTPFITEPAEGEGQILKSALNVDLRDGELGQSSLRSTRADVSYDDFKVTFIKNGASAPVSSYRYGDMPDIVTLEKGAYTVAATYGENLDAEWNNPYYSGQSDVFNIRAGEITDDIGEIVCRLENIKVSIAFAPMLTQQMSESSYVEVKVAPDVDDNSVKGLQFTKYEEGNGISGYFRYVKGVSLVATFNGMVEGLRVSATKAIKEVEKGNHYKITFKLHTQEGDNQGDANAEIDLDTSVTVTNVERNVDIEDDEILDDSERPTEGDPGKPDDPNPPVPGGAPVIVGVAPIDIDAVNEVDGSVPVGMKVTSSADGGFSEFMVLIDSPDLTPDELEGVGLSAELNLAETPDQFATPLKNFGFPVNVKGQKEADIEISTMLLGMLQAVGQGHTHNFKLIVTDANGTTEKTLQLHIK